jgi:hypothetical protein
MVVRSLAVAAGAAAVGEKEEAKAPGLSLVGERDRQEARRPHHPPTGRTVAKLKKPGKRKAAK